VTTATTQTAPDPHHEYSTGLAGARTQAEHWATRERWLSHARLAVFLAGIAIGWLAFGTRVLVPLWFAPPVLIFVALLVAHDRTIQRRGRADRTITQLEWGLARLEGRWAGLGQTGDEYREDQHPYASDLDLFGEASLFQLLCTARTPAGQQTLARWLKHQADAEIVRARQQAVGELRPRVDLRQDFALLGEDLRSRLNPEALVRWGGAPGTAFSRRLRLVGLGSTTLMLLTLAVWIFSDVGAIPFLMAALLQTLFALRMRGRVRPIIAAVNAPTRDLALLRGLVERLEREPFDAPHLVALRASLDCEGKPPSQRIAELQRLVDLLDARGNQFFAPIGALLLWSTQLAMAIESWRAHFGPALGPWLEATGEIEALCCLAGYAYEHPADPFPEIVDRGPIFEGLDLGHPLLPPSTCVRNDLRLGREPQAYIMSGSNMSGKSTMLRTVGCNALLALAGAPVRASSLRISPLQIAASIQISDSLQSGTSHFYAEIKRLRQVVELCGDRGPVLFLLDEILHGTNSHDRRIGAAAVVKGLIERGAVGIVTTHDLALAKIAEDLAPRMQNVHFEDHLEEGAMAFDYKLRPGVVTKSNAIALMRSVGLEV